MSYQTYTTEALVCGSHHSHTSDRSYLLFTETAGMLWAAAKSVREEKSKQRYALQDCSLLRVSLVKGKSGWRIGSAEAIGNAFLRARSRSERAFVKNTVTLLRRYIHGEVQLRGLFADVRALFTDSVLPKDDALQLVFTIRLLYALGYISRNPSLDPILNGSIADAYHAHNPAEAGNLEKLIQQAHNISHL